MSKGRHNKAYESMCKLRYLKVQAARDAFYMHTLLDAESKIELGRNKVVELIAVPRNRRAVIASEIVMFMQQVSWKRNHLETYESSLFTSSVVLTLSRE